jgi:hypothetical protein
MHRHYDFYGYEKTSNVKEIIWETTVNGRIILMWILGEWVRECMDWNKWFTKESKIHFRIP